MRAKVRSSYILTLVWTFLFAAVFFPSINDPFLTTYGDGEAVVENAGIRSLSLSSDKPLTTLLYSLEFKFFKFHAPAYHALHLLIHWLNTLLIFLFLKRLGLSITIASLITLVLDIHPMRAESAIWIAKLDNILSSFFCLLSLLSYQELRSKGRWFWGLACFIAFLAACASNAAFSIGLPLVFLALDAHQPQSKSSSLFKSPFFAVSLGIASYAAYQSGWPGWQVVIENVLLTGYALAYHAGMFFMPLILSSYHPRPELQAPVFLLAAATALVCLVLWRNRKAHPHVFLGGAFYLALFTPKVLASVWQPSAAFFSDHDSYLPVIGLAFMAAHWMKNRATSEMTRRACWLIVYAGWVLWLSWLSITRTDTFKSDVSVWTDALKNYPSAEAPLYGRGRAYILAKDYEAAAQDLKKAVEVDPDNTLARFYLGEALLKAGKSDEGEQVFRAVLERDPKNAECWSRLGESEMERGARESAKSSFEKALSLDAQDWRAYSGLGALAVHEGDMHKALSYLERATALKPSSSVPYARSFAVNTLLGRKTESAQAYSQAAKWEADSETLLKLFKREFERCGSSFDYEQ